MDWVLIVGLVATAVTLFFAGRRVAFLARLITSGQPAPDRLENLTKRLGTSLKAQVVEVFGQRKLLKWTVPGAAHFFVFWAFLILATVYLEAYGALFDRSFSIPLVGTWPVLGFAQDLIAVLAVVSLVVFANIRLKNSPEKLGRRSRFKGSHLGGAWLVLLMIFNVIWTMFLFRGAASALGNLPYENGAFVSIGIGRLLDGLPHDALEVLEGIGLLLHIGVMLTFLILVLNSKHLHIFVAPLNVLFGRRPVALGAVKPLTNEGKAVTLDDIDDLDEDATLGVGTIEDFTWKGLLDMATCTECGRCQSQCPAWNTEKPLSPKLLIMELRDHAFAKAPYVLAGEGGRDGLSDEVKAEADRPLIGDASAYGVIDPDVLWSCVTCGACVEQCPVDIEHVDHIVDMRRYQVLVESNFPAELNQLFKGMENKGNPWNMSPTARMDWAKDLPFDVKVVGDDIESLDEVDWLFWVGCAGAYEDRAKKTTRAVAELLDLAGVSFGVLGNGETCTGDQARRAGNEFVFQGLAQQNVETFKEYKVKKVVSTCAHCFNTLKNEYRELGVELEVVHHTQLLNRLVREGRLTPVREGAGAEKRSITYHDPCYIGRHNGVYTPPRELLQVLPGAEVVEMERNSERSFCCGAGGARMWMEETIGERINVNRTKEAVATGADQIAVGCPFCRVMLSDGLTAEQASGGAREEVEVLDVAQMLLASVKGESATKARAKSGTNGAAARTAAPAAGDEATRAEPEAGDATQSEDTVTATEEVGPAAKASSGGGSSLFDVGGDDADEPAAEAGKPAGAGGGSLFDLGGDDDGPAGSATSEKTDEAVERAEKAAPSPAPAAKPAGEDLGSGGSLFDLGGGDEPESTTEEAVPPAATDPAAKAEAEAVAEEEPTEEPVPAETGADQSAEAGAAPAADSGPAEEIPSGSLFDIEAPAAAAEPSTEPEAAAEPSTEPEATVDEQPEPEPDAKPDSQPQAAAEPAPAATPQAEIPEGGSLFDIAAPEPADQPEPAAEPESAAEPEPASQPEAATSTEAEPAEDAPTGGAALSAAATRIASDDAPTASAAEASSDEAASNEAGPDEAVSDQAEPDEAASDEAAPDEAADEAQTDEPEPKRSPAADGPSHQPRTDADIDGSGSLFDL